MRIQPFLQQSNKLTHGIYRPFKKSHDPSHLAASGDQLHLSRPSHPKQPQFRALVKISGTGAARTEKKGSFRFSLQEALEFARDYKRKPQDYAAGYFSDPTNKYKVWTATSDEKWLLDEARGKSENDFAKMFKTLKRKKGTRNYILMEPVALSTYLDTFISNKK
jgi:hypothetical protein